LVQTAYLLFHFLWLQKAVELPGHVTKIYSSTKAIDVDSAFGNRPLAAPEYYCFDLIINDQGFSFPLAVAVDVIDPDSSRGGLI
jgi:hypothetical protein